MECDDSIVVGGLSPADYGLRGFYIFKVESTEAAKALVAADPAIRREIARAYRRLANIHRNLGQYAEAEKGYRKAFAMFAELEAQSPLEPSLRRDLSSAHLEIAACVRDLGNREEQEKHTRRAVEIGGAGQQRT